MKITYLGHSCFRLESGNFAVILDPYREGSVPGLAPLHERAGAVYASHVHADHNGVEAVQITGGENPFAVRFLPSFHDDREGALRGKNTITILEAEGLMAVHLGDLGCDPGPEIMDEIRYCDVLMIPVGGHYTIDAGTAHRIALEAEPRVVIPMHYRTACSGYDEISTIDPFLALRKNAVIAESDTLELEPGTPEQTLVLRQRQLSGESS